MLLRYPACLLQHRTCAAPMPVSGCTAASRPAGPVACQCCTACHLMPLPDCMTSCPLPAALRQLSVLHFHLHLRLGGLWGGQQHHGPVGTHPIHCRCSRPADPVAVTCHGAAGVARRLQRRHAVDGCMGARAGAESGCRSGPGPRAGQGRKDRCAHVCAHSRADSFESTVSWIERQV